MRVTAFNCHSKELRSFDIQKYMLIYLQNDAELCHDGMIRDVFRTSEKAEAGQSPRLQQIAFSCTSYVASQWEVNEGCS